MSMFKTRSKAFIQKKDVGVGTIVWYKGFTSTGAWDCPAVIYKVIGKHKFCLISLDDMGKQHQEYQAISLGALCFDSNKDMRLASIAEVDAYLSKKKSKFRAADIITIVQLAAKEKIEFPLK